MSTMRSSKQRVILTHDAEDKQDVDIVSADEVSPAVWSLKLCENPQCSGAQDHDLQAMPEPPGSDPQSSWRKLVFTDYGVAIRLAHWLRTNPNSTPANTPYKFNFPRDAGRTYVSLVPVKATRDECKADPPEEVSHR